MKPVKYKYRASDAGKCGWYQADMDDVKAFFKACTKKTAFTRWAENMLFGSSTTFVLYWLVIDMGNGTFWVWTNLSRNVEDPLQETIGKWYKVHKLPWWAK